MIVGDRHRCDIGPSFERIAGRFPRALYRSMGFTDADFAKPLIGIANSWSEVDPGHFHLRQLAEWVKQGVRDAGGTPAEFNTVAPCDGIAQGRGMHYVLPLRDIIAASIELMVGANRFDGLVMLCNCDKIVPGMLMAAARVDLPTLFVTGGSMASGKIGNRPVMTSDVKEGMGKLQSREYDMLLLDIMMGRGAEGIMIARKLRKDPKLSA